MRRHFQSQAPWESQIGYARAVRSGNVIEVSGTVSVKDGSPYGIDDAYMQSVRIFEIITEALEALGGSVSDVVRTRIYLTDIARDADAVGRAHLEFFGAVRPAISMIGVQALIAPEYLVEVETTAIIEAGQKSISTG